MNGRAEAAWVFGAAFAVVAGLGFAAARWRPAGAGAAQLEEWGLGGRRFGTWVTWFLIGGDFYTAYTVIAVPALVYATGAGGFFALPYTILVYPIVFAVMPRLWSEAAACGGATAADLVRRRHLGQRWAGALELAVAATGILATMPYIALQLLGMEVAIRAIGLPGEAPLLAAFAVLALYTYVSGLRAPALIAFAKDIMIAVVVVAAVAVIPARLGGYGATFAAAGRALATGGPGVDPGAGLLLGAGRALPFATLALGSAGAAFLYPHTLTGTFAASGPDTIRRNAILLPAYTVLLGLVAMLGYMARAAGVHASGIDVVPALFASLFPPWFAGFALAAIAVAALVPAAVMSIGAANLFARNVWGLRRTRQTPAGEARVAKLASLAVKVGALACILGLPTRYAIDLQLLGGIWILQTLPAVMLGAAGRFGPGALLAGWAAGFAGGSLLFLWRDRLSPLHVLRWGGGAHEIYTGLLMLGLNLAVALAAESMARARRKRAVRPG